MYIANLVGFAGSGKNSVADVLIEDFNFRSMSFAGALKDAVAVIFAWERRLLEGDTAESRKWRDQVDHWWARELGIPDFTPRYALQNIGTNVFRYHFHSDMWLLTVKRQIIDLGPDARVVITDCRFPNELAMTTPLGGKIIRVKRGPDPSWWNSQLRLTNGFYTNALSQAYDVDLRAVSNVHESERAWARSTYDYTIVNDGTLDDLRTETHNMMRTLNG